MIDMHVFLMGLLVVSTVSSLATEAVKKILSERDKTYHANTLAGVVATVVSLFTGVGYTLIAHIPFSVEVAVYLIALIFMSWLCAMVGYDKVIQTLSQFKMEGKDD